MLNVDARNFTYNKRRIASLIELKKNCPFEKDLISALNNYDYPKFKRIFLGNKCSRYTITRLLYEIVDQGYTARPFLDFMLGHGVNINMVLKHTIGSPLSKACYNGDLELVKYLVSVNADKYLVGRYFQLLPHHTPTGDLPVHTSVGKYKYDVARYLLNEDEDVNLVGSEKETLLSMMAGRNDIDFTKFLLEKGALASVNNEDSHGRTALLKACESDSHLRFVEMLCIASCDVIELLGREQIYEYKNSKGESAIDVAKRNRCSKILKYFETGEVTTLSKDLYQSLVHISYGYVCDLHNQGIYFQI